MTKNWVVSVHSCILVFCLSWITQNLYVCICDMPIYMYTGVCNKSLQGFGDYRCDTISQCCLLPTDLCMVCGTFVRMYVSMLIARCVMLVQYCSGPLWYREILSSIGTIRRYAARPDAPQYHIRVLSVADCYVCLRNLSLSHPTGFEATSIACQFSTICALSVLSEIALYCGMWGLRTDNICSDKSSVVNKSIFKYRFVNLWAGFIALQETSLSAALFSLYCCWIHLIQYCQ